MKKLIGNTEYHAHEALGSSTLKKIASKSLLHALSVEFKQTDAMALGSAVHAAVLEPETYEQEFLELPKIDRRTKAGKEAYANFLELSEGKTIVSADQAEKVPQIVKALTEHDIAKAMLSGGEAEYSYFSKDEVTGIELKCRPDYFNMNSLIDLKTCVDASNEGFLRACINFGYHIQAAFYLDVFNASQGTSLNEFYFIAVETTAPFAVNIFKMGEVELTMGRELYRKALNEYAKFQESGPASISEFGYTKKINEINFPIWALTQAEEKLGA